MATRTVDEGFRDFLTRLTPSTVESEAAKNHRASIKACLEANFGLKRFFRTGSFGNGTSISGYSDVDYFASIPTEKLKNNSSTSLTEIKDVLAIRFPNTGVKVSCPAICLPFGTNAKEMTEVVPADFVSNNDGIHVYEIPDCSGGWMNASPDAHNAYVRTVDQKLNGKVKPLIRFIKAWKYYNNVPISSFYLELRVAKYADGESSIVYDIDVKSVFAHLSNVSLAKIQDPAGISGLISPCSSDVKLEDAKSKLNTALVRATKAREASDKQNVSDAFYWWNLVFNGNFPGYNK